MIGHPGETKLSAKAAAPGTAMQSGDCRTSLWGDSPQWSPGRFAVLKGLVAASGLP
jgi:hypothetical protein